MDQQMGPGAIAAGMFAEVLFLHLIGFAAGYSAARGNFGLRNSNGRIAFLFLLSWLLAGTVYTVLYYPGRSRESPLTVLIPLAISVVSSLLFALTLGRRGPAPDKLSAAADDGPAITGGDGLTAGTPAVVNCASIGLARRLVGDFVTDRLGAGFTEGPKFTIAAPDNPQKLLSLERFTDKDGQEHAFYFDLSRPVRNAAKMMGLEH